MPEGFDRPQFMLQHKGQQMVRVTADGADGMGEGEATGSIIATKPKTASDEREEGTTFGRNQ